MKEFTGVSDPYEAPQNAELVIDSSDVDPEKLVEQIYDFIKSLSFI